MAKLEHLMVIEDDPDIRDILELSLDTLGGFTLSLHENARSALEAVEAFQPQLVLLDVMLPDMSGPDMLPLLRQACKGAQPVVVLLTANARTGVRDEYLQLGVQEVMFKPFDPVTLAGLLEGIWLQNQPH